MTEWLTELQSNFDAAIAGIGNAARLLSRPPYLRATPTDEDAAAMLAIRRALGLADFATTHAPVVRNGAMPRRNELEAACRAWPQFPQLLSVLTQFDEALALAAAEGRAGLLPRPDAENFLTVHDDGQRFKYGIAPGNFGALVLTRALPESSPWRAAFSDASAVLVQIPPGDNGASAPGEFPEWLSVSFVMPLPETALPPNQREILDAEESRIDAETRRYLAEQQARKAAVARRRVEAIMEAAADHIKHETDRREKFRTGQFIPITH
jgi:hypothetical protein